MKDSIADHISGIVDNMKTYINAKTDFILLSTFERFGKYQSYLLSTIILILIACFCVFFITIAIALWIGELVESTRWGFVIMAGFYVILAIIFSVFKKYLIERSVIKKLMRIFFPNEEN